MDAGAERRRAEPPVRDEEGHPPGFREDGEPRKLVEDTPLDARGAEDADTAVPHHRAAGRRRGPPGKEVPVHRVGVGRELWPRTARRPRPARGQEEDRAGPGLGGGEAQQGRPGRAVGQGAGLGGDAAAGLAPRQGRRQEPAQHPGRQAQPRGLGGPAEATQGEAVRGAGVSAAGLRRLASHRRRPGARGAGGRPRREAQGGGAQSTARAGSAGREPLDVPADRGWHRQRQLQGGRSAPGGVPAEGLASGARQKRVVPHLHIPRGGAGYGWDPGRGP
mmetsp:Transcript_9248/g.25928  ORF Transcript_9248/g.25928 Transcript_9248/m.25928 type:complete len:277 (-) Transcript_9248:364-1194(-)